MGPRNPAKKTPQAAAAAASEGIWQSGVVRRSEAFEAFYKEQKIVPEGEPAAAARPPILPLSLRFQLLFASIWKGF